MCQVWCSGIQCIYAQLQGANLPWVYVHCAIYAQLVGQSVIDPCYTITPPLPLDHISLLHHYTSAANLP